MKNKMNYSKKEKRFLNNKSIESVKTLFEYCTIISVRQT